MKENFGELIWSGRKALRGGKSAKTAIYENGIVYEYNPQKSKLEQIELAFNDVAFIQPITRDLDYPICDLTDVILVILFFIFIYLPIKLVSLVIPALRGLKVSGILIFKKTGTQIKLKKRRIPDFKQFTDEVDKAFARWLLRTFMQEHDGLEITFGRKGVFSSDMSDDGLIFYRGQFIVKRWSSDERVIPFSDINGVKVNRTGGGWLLGAKNRIGRPKKLVKFAGNASTLSLIVQMIVAQKQNRKA